MKKIKPTKKQYGWAQKWIPNPKKCFFETSGHYEKNFQRVEIVGKRWDSGIQFLVRFEDGQIGEQRNIYEDFSLIKLI